ncbi:porin family protein [Pedobacter sp. SYP-B3415]|uniref:porin family protein n=1 Tax=Pedobacter sp. SYP-B3415 TaxID=2496641 RepID=UPI00101C718B|nr:porin family protein [Pedobacter sp. SYP-B3415]
MKQIFLATALLLLTIPSVNAQAQKPTAKKKHSESKTASSSASKQTKTKNTGATTRKQVTRPKTNGNAKTSSPAKNNAAAKPKPASSSQSSSSTTSRRQGAYSDRSLLPQSSTKATASSGSKSANGFLKKRPPRFGIRAGLNLSRFAVEGGSFNGVDDDYQSYLPGFNASIFLNLNISDRFAVQPAISLQGKGTQLKRTDLPGENGSFKISALWLEVPVNAVYSIPAGQAGTLMINAGPYVSYGLSGKLRIETESGATESADVRFGSAATDQFTKLDFGLNGGLGFRLDNGASLNAGYGFGLADLTPKDRRNANGANKYSNRVISFSIGYAF